MGVMSEIYLTKKFVTKEEWLEFIQTISKYNGIFRRWKITVQNDKNQIRYFVDAGHTLPSTINHLDAFLLKPTQEFYSPKYNHTFFLLSKKDSSLIDLINYSEIRNKGTFVYLEILFFPWYENNIQTKIYFYMNQNGIMRRYKILLANPPSILSVDFGENKRYFYNGTPKYLEIKKILPLLSSSVSDSLFFVDTFPYLQGNYYFSQNSFSFDKHSLIIGSSGCGKSKLISSLIYNINQNEFLRQKYKVIVIDPHAALEKDIGGMGKVIDFRTNCDSINLFINEDEDIVSSTELLLDLFKSLMENQYNSKLERVLRHSIYLLLTDKSFCLITLKKLILDLEYRNTLIHKLKEDLPMSVIDFFLSDFNDLKTKSYGEAISPIINFIEEMEMIPIFGSNEIENNLKDTIQNHFLTLFSLNRTKLGNKVTKTIAGLLMQQLLTIVQKQSIDSHIILVIDEVAIVENPILSRYLAETRKYHLSLILLGQYFNQISNELKNSIFANVMNYFIFRVSKTDAITLVDNIHMTIPLEDSKERKVQLLMELNNRECVIRVTDGDILLPAFKGSTLNYKSVPRIQNLENGDIKNEKNMNLPSSSQTQFSLYCNVRLKDILMANSSSRKVVKE